MHKTDKVTVPRKKYLLPARIRVLQRVVQTVRVPVVALREVGQLHKVVGGEEAGDHGVVQAAVHVDDLQVGVVLVAGEAMCVISNNFIHFLYKTFALINNDSIKKATIIIVCKRAMATTRTIGKTLFKFSIDLTKDSPA